MKSPVVIRRSSSVGGALARSLALLLFATGLAAAQFPLAVYTDSLTNTFDDWSWTPTRNLANATPVHSGNRSISVTASAWEALSFHHPDFDSSPFDSLSFWVHGGGGGQRLQVYAEYGSSAGPTYVLPAALPTNAWQSITIPLGTLGIANKANVNRFSIQLRNDGTAGTFYVDDIQFTAKSMPAIVNVSLNASAPLRSVDARHFGVNLAIWDVNYEPASYAATAALLQEMGCRFVRLPGGSLSDEYHWSSNTTWTNTWQWSTSFPEFMRAITNAGAQVMVTVNHGSGSPQEAAAWVAYANGDATLYGTINDLTIGVDAAGRDWRSVGYWARLRTLTAAANPDNQFDFLAMNRSAPLGIKHWEIGNECYGTWERDTNALPSHAYTYAVRATNFIVRMKAVDPTIKIGVVAVPGESAYANGYTDHPAFNPRTGQNNYGWTPVLLATLKSFGVTPDFLVHHHYPEWTDPSNVPASPDNDATLLQSTGNWATDAATLRQHIADYFGAGGTNIELLVTENNSDAGQQGKQSTSLVNGLYYADSLAQLIKTEFNSFVWWDLRNSTDAAGYFGANLYGWRPYGDLGMINDLSTRHPTFYAAKLMQWLARPGDKTLNAASDYAWLSAYAARGANGVVTLLLLNKFSVTNLNAQVALNGFTPTALAAARSFGIPNDEAARTNGPAAAQDITTNYIANAGTNFSFVCAPLSLNLLTLAPAAPRLAVVAPAPPGQLVFQLLGQPEVRYVIQNSSNLTSWLSVSTNTLTSSRLNFTNPVAASAPQNYWRAVWQP